MKTYAYGYPRLGPNREYKKTIESFWKGQIDEPQLEKGLDDIQRQMNEVYERYVDIHPVGEITGYDPMFDTAVMVGLYRPANRREYYELCRGKDALEMTKWFNTNYHFLVPDFASPHARPLELHKNDVRLAVDSFGPGPVALIGPFTFLKLSKGLPAGDFASTLQQLARIYREALQGCEQAHIEEPAFVLELTPAEIDAARAAYDILAESACAINLITYYDAVDWLERLYEFPVTAIGLDFVHGPANLDHVRKNGFPADKTLIAGLVDGRNIWKTDAQQALKTLGELAGKAGEMMLSNAGPLYHVPISLQGEQLSTDLLDRLAFAHEKLAELRQLADFHDGGKAPKAKGPTAQFGADFGIRQRIANLSDADFTKAVPLKERRTLHEERLGLPTLPTTTIGSFPQTADVRRHRADFRAGRSSDQEYGQYIREQIAELIEFQNRIGLDVLVHGEFERTDMVEFFAEKLDGVATTRGGWIISYGTRGYRPPIIYGDIARPHPMTINEVAYAQSLTKKPVKGMLTGPVTIISWSFVREDIPTSEVAYQLGLALREEIRDYEKAGIAIVQVDEPAIREKAPLKKHRWPDYFDWAVKAFNLTTNTDAATQIHTHICYSEFGEIIDQINRMDFDVISIETTRSKGDIIEHFEKIDFQRQIGLGVWDIHSPAVPEVDEMVQVIQRALKVIPRENFWINPDCGLKTRDWPETEAALRNLVAAAEQMRK